MAVEAPEQDGDVDVALDTTTIYANVRQLTYVVKVADLAAYVDDRRLDDGFKKEFLVSLWLILN